MRIAINGFGRIGRSVFRVLNERDDIDVVAINDIFEKGALAYLLKYDTVMGRFPDNVDLQDDVLKTSSQNVKLLAERDPEKLPWGEMNVDIVVESTGIFRQRNQLEKHIKAGAKRVILTVPSKDEIDYTVVLGVNDSGLNDSHKLFLTQAVPQIALRWPKFYMKLLKLNLVSSIQSKHTNDQRLADVHTVIEEVELPQKMSYQQQLEPPVQLVSLTRAKWKT